MIPIKRLLPYLRIVAVLVVAAAVVAFILVSVFWRTHDEYDDTGYMLAMFKGLFSGGALYREVFSQYGPFHGQAWLTFFRITGFPLDHNHLGVGVALLWAGSVFLAAIVAGRSAGSMTTACLCAWWTAWTLQCFSGELGHPLSLCTFLVLAVIAAAIAAKRDGSGMALLLGGACLAALFFIKINLGVFQITAVALALLLAWTRDGWQSRLVFLLSLAVPLVLLRSGWTMRSRGLLAAGVLLSTPMILMAWRRMDHPVVPWRPELWKWLGGFAAATAVIVGLALQQGMSFHELREGMVDRPLGLAGTFSVLLTVSAVELVLLGLAVVLAMLWLVLSLGDRRLPEWWANMVWLIGALLLGAETWSWTMGKGVLWNPGVAALLWLPLTLRTPFGLSRAMLLVALSAVWQSLGVFPVYGSQITIPAVLGTILWIMALGGALVTRPEGSTPRPLRITRVATGICLLLISGWLASVAWQQHARALSRYARFHVPGASRFSFPRHQAAPLETVVANVKEARGPLFSSPGQNSLVAWAEKPFLTWFNCGHIAGLLRRAELQASLDRFHKEPAWVCVVYADGKGLFGGGSLLNVVEEFVSSETRPWFRCHQYEVRLKRGQEATPLRHAIWKQGSTWMISVPEAEARRAKKWQLCERHLPFASGQWLPPAGPENTFGDYISMVLPPEVASALDSAASHTRDFATFWLCDTDSRPLIGVAVVSREETPPMRAE